MPRLVKPDHKLIQVNTIYYDVKSCQVITTIVNCTQVRLEILKILTSHIRDVDTVNRYVTQLQNFKERVISSMWGVFGWLKWKQGLYASDSIFYLTSFQLHRIEPGGTETKNSRNGTQNINRPHTQNTQINLVAVYLGDIDQPTAGKLKTVSSRH